MSDFNFRDMDDEELGPLPPEEKARAERVQRMLDEGRDPLEYDALTEIVEENFGQTQRPETARSSLREQARMRTEQANLYMTLIDSDLFEGGSARPEILHIVTEELRAFASDRLATLLGIKPEQKAAPVETKSPFSKDETDALKLLAARIMKTNPPAPKDPDEVPTPKIKTIGAPKPQATIAPRPQPQAPAPVQKRRPAPAPAQKPVQRQAAPQPKAAAPAPAATPQTQQGQPVPANMRGVGRKRMPSLQEREMIAARQSMELQNSGMLTNVSYSEANSNGEVPMNNERGD